MFYKRSLVPQTSSGTVEVASQSDLMFPVHSMKKKRVTNFNVNFATSFLCLSDVFREDVAVWRRNVCVIVLDGICDFKSKFLIEVDGILIVCLHMQVNLRNILLRAEIKNMIQQFCTCIIQAFYQYSHFAKTFFHKLSLCSAGWFHKLEYFSAMGFGFVLMYGSMI